jgi:hypothetical protein
VLLDLHQKLLANKKWHHIIPVVPVPSGELNEICTVSHLLNNSSILELYVIFKVISNTVFMEIDQ